MSVSKKVLRRMKKVMGAVSTIPVLTACSSQVSFAEKKTIWVDNQQNGNYVRYDLDEEERTLTISGNGVVTSSWRECAEANSWFWLLLGGKVVIKNGIREIGASAFEGKNVVDVDIPNSVTVIGERAFFATSLKNLYLPDSVIRIGSNAFAHSDVENVFISNKVKEVGDFAFASCKSLEKITIPNSVITIGEGAFSHCTSLGSITIPGSVTTIGKDTFAYCKSLEKITIPNSVIAIGEGAFRDCVNLGKVIIPESVISVGKGAFQRCKSLTTVVFEGDDKDERALLAFDFCRKQEKKECEAKKRDKKILSLVPEGFWPNFKSEFLSKFLHKNSSKTAELCGNAFYDCGKLVHVDTHGRKLKCIDANVFKNTPLENQLKDKAVICGNYRQPRH